MSADETPQVVPVDASADAEEPVASTSQPTTTEADADLRQEPSSESAPSAAVGFLGIEQSAAVQQLTRDGSQERQVLHVCLGPLPDAHAACKAFYFLRDQPGKVTPEDMDTQIECGVLSEGPSLKMLQQVTCPLWQSSPGIKSHQALSAQHSTAVQACFVTCLLSAGSIQCLCASACTASWRRQAFCYDEYTG